MSAERRQRNVQQVEAAIAGVRRHVELRRFAGYDPYDALNGPLVRLLTGGTKWGRIAWTQLFRRLPLNLRPVVGVPRGENPKGLGLFLGSYARLYTLGGGADELARIDELVERLARLRSPGCSGNGWGYNFPWQSKAFYLPRYTPTVVNSAFIGHALLDAWRATGRQRALDLAVPVAEFIRRDLHRTRDGDAFAFSYTPIDRTAIHNANLLGASLLIRLHHETGQPGLRDDALASLAYSTRRQRPDGSWWYAETEFQRWIDSFHTGFNLQSLRYFLAAGEAGDDREGYERGVEYYASRFFLENGAPKYYHDRLYPFDIHCPTQAIAFFAGMGPDYQDLCDRVLEWMLRAMWDRRGYFYFRRGRWLTNRIAYMRWGQAWALHALTEWLLHRRANGDLDATGARQSAGCTAGK